MDAMDDLDVATDVVTDPGAPIWVMRSAFRSCALLWFVAGAGRRGVEMLARRPERAFDSARPRQPLPRKQQRARRSASIGAHRSVA
jgi:hypothetical protein